MPSADSPRMIHGSRSLSKWKKPLALASKRRLAHSHDGRTPQKPQSAASAQRSMLPDAKSSVKFFAGQR